MEALPSKPQHPAALDDTQRLQLLIDAVTDYAIYMLEPGGHVTSWNSGAQKLKGYRPGEIIGQHFSHFFTPEDQAAGLPMRLLTEAREKGRAESEGWRVRKDGKRFWGLAVLHAMRDPSGALIGFAKVTRDITERMAAEQERLESDRRFRLLVEGVTDYAIYMLEPERHHHQLERRRPAPQGLCRERNRRAAFLALLSPGGPRGRAADPDPEPGDSRGAV